MNYNSYSGVMQPTHLTFIVLASLVENFISEQLITILYSGLFKSYYLYHTSRITEFQYDISRMELFLPYNYFNYRMDKSSDFEGHYKLKVQMKLSVGI